MYNIFLSRKGTSNSANNSLCKNIFFVKKRWNGEYFRQIIKTLVQSISFLEFGQPF